MQSLAETKWPAEVLPQIHGVAEVWVPFGGLVAVEGARASSEPWEFSVENGRLVKRGAISPPNVTWRTYHDTPLPETTGPDVDSCHNRWIAWKALATWSPLADCVAAKDDECIELAKALTRPERSPDQGRMLVPFANPGTNGYLVIVDTFWQTYFVHIGHDLQTLTGEVGGTGGATVPSP